MSHKMLRGVFALAGLLSLGALAQQDGTGGPPDGGSGAQSGSTHRPSGPPPEAYAACDGKSAGASVSFTLRNGKVVQGVCEQVGDRLVVGRPSRSGMHGGGTHTDDGTMPGPPSGAE
ncbi:MAG: hypothetical protein JWR07_3043 [Nevskia sp.]|nr:hypothetical protein [Nevskia sp.]